MAHYDISGGNHNASNELSLFLGVFLVLLLVGLWIFAIFFDQKGAKQAEESAEMLSDANTIKIEFTVFPEKVNK